MSKVYACILAEVEREQTFKVAQDLSKLEFVGLVVPTTGPYDIMVVAQADDPTTLGKIIVTELQGTPGIQSTLTLIFLDQLEPYNWLRQLLSS